MSEIKGEKIKSVGKFHRLQPGDIIRVGIGNMDGEMPKVGDRCLLKKMFVCKRIITEADIALNNIVTYAHFGRIMNWWTETFVRIAIWIAYGPKRRRKICYYEVVFTGEEKE